MKLRTIRSNMNEITLPNGTVVLFSYQTPVAACIGNGSGFVRTDKFWSRTTSKHIGQWLNGANACTVPQSELDALTA